MAQYLCWSLALHPRHTKQYACGLKLASAAILNQNPMFELGSTKLFIVFADHPHHPAIP
jgi:hypothetical protein